MVLKLLAGSVSMTSNQGGSKGIQQANSRVKAENQGNVNSLQEDDELVNNSVDENVQNGCKQVAVQGNYIRQTPQQQPQGSLAHWERFLHVRSIKVMLVEDDDCTRHIVTALLRNCNYEVIQAANGFQAWKILENLSNHIDIVLTEVVMPCLSGIGLLCKIMSHKTRKNVPVIMMSSHDSMGLVFKCLSKGAVDFLVKPIRKNELKILWQHVWRRCHSSSGSGSESGTKAQKSVNSKGNLGYDSSGSKNGDENERTDDGSDDGNGTQSSWAKQAIECESPEAASSTEYPDSTCGFVIRPTNDQEAQPDDVGNGIEIAISQSRNLEMQIEFPIDVLISNKDKVLDNNMPGPHMENGENEGQEPEKTIIDDSNGLKVGETGLKRPRETENDVRDVQNGCNILRHSELSAFTRYKTNSSAVKGTPGIIASCSQPVNRSNIVKKESKRDVHSDGYLIYQGSSEQIIPKNADVITRDNLNQEPQIQHIHHHHQVHHYHNLDTEEPLSNQETFGLNKLAVDAPHCGSSNIMGGPVEGNFESYSLNKSASGGSMHGSNGGNPAVNFEVTDVESNVGVPGKSGSGDASGGGGGDDGSGGGGNGDHNKSAQREAALIKFRQKREVRCFQKKVRYQNRKKLADQRPRVRGQFVKGTSRDSLNKAANG